MMTLFAAALVAAAPPAAPANPQPHAMPMNHEQHEAMKDECCCEDMAKHDGHADATSPQEHSGR
jgi:hypothetical protein